MMNNNKILTVSYGTFSCTLEGFDDSFDTMKAIAEYFRDLAADDRYFGAEPPQPDAEMLAKIAEREVARRVEAHEHEGRIMLKAHDSDADQPGQPAAPLMAPAADESVQTADVMPSAEAVADVDVAEADVDVADADVAPPQTMEAAEPAAQTEDEITVEDSAAAFFANSPTVTETLEENDATEEISVEAFTNYIAAGAAPAADAEPAADAVESSAPTEYDTDLSVEADDDSVVDDDAADYIAETAAAEVTSEAYEDDASQQFEPLTETFETDSTEDIKIEDTTHFEEDDAVATEDSSDPLIVDEMEPTSKSIFAAENFADKLQRIRDVVASRDEEDADYDEDDELSSEEMTSFDKMQKLSAAEEVDETRYTADAARDIEDALAMEDQDADDLQSEEIDELDGILSRIDAAAQDEEIASTPWTPERDGSPLSDENIFDEEVSKETDDQIEDVSVDGRILKVNRAALDAALEAGELEEYSDAAETADQASEHAAPQAGIDADDAKPVAARQSLPEIDESVGNDVSRLMAEADEQMDEPEGKTRRSAFAHLRAAVAARFADRSMEKDAEQEEQKETEAYRSDLAEVVKPRRPVAGADEAKRTGAARPSSPLKLVAEQRIDPDHQEDFDTVSPRRVAASAAEDLILEEDTDFAEYADELGAHTLPEVLEAAAAYLCHVEGVEQFSRPQLMSRVKQSGCGDFTREDGLRAFGQLLRTGKIEKIRGGRFVASDAIGFKPGHRAAG